MIYEGLRVVEVASGIAGAYCSKLLTDLGADVVVVEPAEGTPLRRDRPELFTYLRTSQRSVVGDPLPWVESADIVIEGLRPGEAETRGLLGVAPVSVSISSFGRGGPDSGLSLSEAVLQARCGALSAHGHMNRPPLTVGGELGEWVTGAFAALGGATAWGRARRTGVPEHVDVSMLEAMQLTMVTVPTLMARFPGGFLGTFRWVMIPGNEPTRDGYVGITTVTAPQWRALLGVMGRDDLAGDEELATMIGRFRRAREVIEMLHSYTTARTSADVVEECAAARVPAAVVGNGELLPGFPQPVARDSFVSQPGEAWIRPRAPFRLHGVPDRSMSPAPALGAHRADRPPSPRVRPGAAVAVGERPLAGITVVDFTAFWSGPFATAWLCAMGADVVKVESRRKPDGIRFSAAVRPGDDPDYLEKSALFHAANLAKRGITLELDRPDGLERARALIAEADVVAENFTPRVMESFGLDYERVRELRPDVVMLRLPAFGLTGPWRDRPGFAQTMEQLTGMAWVTGYDGGPPVIPGGVVDPMVGAHAALALVAALDHRVRTGRGMLVEMPMIEVAAAVTAEQVIEWSAHGRLRGRRGEGGVYQCAGDHGERAERWVAIDLATDPLAPETRAAWCAERSAEVAVAELTAEGIAAAAMVDAYTVLDDPQLRARGFFESIAHPLVGEQQYPGFPMRLSAGPHTWWRGPAPLLGQDDPLSEA